MSEQAAASRAASALSDLGARPREDSDGVPTFELEREHVRAAFERLRGPGGFDQSTFVTAVDHHPTEPRFELVWQFRSYAHGERARLVCRVGGADPVVPSCCDLWPGANWSEREVWDLFGVRFEGHPDLRRLLMPEGYGHHPLRKDFPHQGIEPDRLYRQWDRERRARWQVERGGAERAP